MTDLFIPERWPQIGENFEVGCEFYTVSAVNEFSVLGTLAHLDREPQSIDEMIVLSHFEFAVLADQAAQS